MFITLEDAAVVAKEVPAAPKFELPVGAAKKRLIAVPQVVVNVKVCVCVCVCVC